LNPKEVVPHTLRHTVISHAVQAGIDLPTVQHISGHKTLSMVMRYTHRNSDHVQAAMDRLEERYARKANDAFAGTITQELHKSHSQQNPA
jgi:site-specific recombinase XerD